MPITSTWKVVTTSAANTNTNRWDLVTSSSDVVASVTSAANYTYNSVGIPTYYTIENPVYYTEKNIKNWNDMFAQYFEVTSKKKVKFIQEEFDV